VPWNFHEFSPGRVDLSSPSRHLARFLRLAQAHNLLVILRPGPYVCAELEFGGLPAWLLADGPVAIRTYAQPYLSHVDRWWGVLLPALKAEGLLLDDGGPVMMLQIENEYGAQLPLVWIPVAQPVSSSSIIFLPSCDHPSPKCAGHFGDASRNVADRLYLEHFVEHTSTTDPRSSPPPTIIQCAGHFGEASRNLADRLYLEHLVELVRKYLGGGLLLSTTIPTAPPLPPIMQCAGHFGDASRNVADRLYLEHLVELARKYLGGGLILFTTDPDENAKLARGTLSVGESKYGDQASRPPTSSVMISTAVVLKRFLVPQRSPAQGMALGHGSARTFPAASR
jgi:hypothetical protein